MIRKLCLGLVLVMLSACGGGGGSSTTTASTSTSATTTTTTTTVTPPLTNFTTLTVDNGPAALQTGANPYIQANVAYVSVTLCAPGSTTNCQTIDHVQVDTGSVGLRIPQSVLNASLLAAMPAQTDANANPVGECYGYVDGYVFGSVRSADFQIGGETVAGMPLQVIGDTGVYSTVPSSCSSGGGTQITTVSDLGANGVIGIGVTTTDCSTYCTVAGGYGAAIYYDCPTTGCSSLITRTNATTAPFQQLPNPIAAMSVDNNGSIMTLPAAPAAGEASMTGTLYFGIGTQTNNTLSSSATVLTTSVSDSTTGAGLLTALYGTQTLPDSFVDSGSNLYFFVDSSIALCIAKDFTGYYCPASPLAIAATLQGANAVTASAAFTLYNAQTQFDNDNAVVPGVGGNPTALTLTNAYPTSFDFGLPFFYGRSIYTALEGRTAGRAVGPYIAY
ncbi:MAG: DUF3443 family protein [Caulobacteraceae bacterium]